MDDDPLLRWLHATASNHTLRCFWFDLWSLRHRPPREVRHAHEAETDKATHYRVQRLMASGETDGTLTTTGELRSTVTKEACISSP
jgi:hypothetical protein